MVCRKEDAGPCKIMKKIERHSALDKFYTKTDTANQCIEYVKKEVNFSDYDIILEPSAGNGSFYTQLPSNKIGLDIDPEHSSIKKQDYLEWCPEKNKRYIVIGNPPFGNNSKLAVEFFNHSATFADVIAFIVPRTFRKHTIQNRLNLTFHLIQDYLLETNSFLLEGKTYSVPCCFQIWKRQKNKREKIILATSHEDFIFTDKDLGEFSLRRVGVLAGKANKNKNFAEASNYFIKSNIGDCLFDRFEEIYPTLKKYSQNTAGNPSIGKGELVKIYTERFSNV